MFRNVIYDVLFEQRVRDYKPGTGAGGGGGEHGVDGVLSTRRA